MVDILKLDIEAHFSKELPADANSENYSRQVEKACFSKVSTKVPSQPEKVHYSTSYLKELGFTIGDPEEFLQIMSGANSFKGFTPYAMCYGGHQFGNWAGQLGDGRAINIAEIKLNNKPLQFQLKGSGPTPYSRNSDGLAVLRSSIREYLCSEAMYHLGVPTTRALSLVKTGDMVPRDIMYNGNQQDEPGAIVCRVAPSFIRFGSFQIFSSRKDLETLKTLVDYTIKYHYPELGKPSKETYIAFYKEVVNRTKKMVLDWQRVGFVHGVMNTDNMSILGLTIDYGPYGWLEDYNPDWTPNTTDSQYRRYRYGQQGEVALWNLAQLASSLYLLIEDAEPLQSIIDEYQRTYPNEYKVMMASKLGLYKTVNESLIPTLEALLQKSEIDMTLFFRELSNFVELSFDSFWQIIVSSTYLNKVDAKDDWSNWFKEYQISITNENVNPETRRERMKLVNPKYVLRNYMAQLAIEAAEKGDYSIIDELYTLLQNPYADQPEYEKWFRKRPEWAKNKIGCSMLSCSS